MSHISILCTKVSPCLELKSIFRTNYFRSAVCAALTIALSGLLFTACSDDSSSSASDQGKADPLAECTVPAFLKKGDKVALLSPSYSTPDSNIQNTAAVLKEWGFEPVIGKNVGKLDAGKYAGTAQERADDFIEALKDTSIKATLSNRGGYGTMSSFIGKTRGKDDNSTLLRDLLKGTVPTYKVPKHKFNQKGKAEGILVGGNMATFVPLVDASDIDVFSGDGIILFMEEVGESLHNIDRMFNALELHGVMKNVKDVVLGEFVDFGTDLNYETTEEMLSRYLKKYNIPVPCGFPAGHDDVNVPIVMGAKVKMDVTDNGATLAFDIDGEKKDVDTEKLLNKPSLAKSLRLMLSGKLFSIDE